MARVLIGCEESGKVRDAFAAFGHEAYSCDLKPSRRPSTSAYKARLYFKVATADGLSPFVVDVFTGQVVNIMALEDGL